MRWLIRFFSVPTLTIVDPFCGGGSTGIAAISLILICGKCPSTMIEY